MSNLNILIEQASFENVGKLLFLNSFEEYRAIAKSSRNLETQISNFCVTKSLLKLVSITVPSKIQSTRLEKISYIDSKIYLE